MAKKDFDYLSYARILKDIQEFKRAGGNFGDEFNILDTPGHKYFRIMFDFNTSPLLASTSNSLVDALDQYDGNGNEELRKGNKAMSLNDLLKLSDKSETTLTESKIKYSEIHQQALDYLLLNDEAERAAKLDNFIALLSNINSISPWYFSSIGGLSDAMDRKFVNDPKTDMSENRKITITCLPDAFDDRISTLLSLYRDVVWSWRHKREVVPANLRKFDMYVFIFETPEYNWHIKDQNMLERIGAQFSSTINGIVGQDVINTFTESPTIGSEQPEFIAKTKKRKGIEIPTNKDAQDYVNPSYKLLKFCNCEIDYNSIRSGIQEINNQTGVSPVYTIEISYHDCYEVSYNPLLQKRIGDVVKTDLIETTASSFASSFVDNVFWENKKQLQRVMYPYKNIGKKILNQLTQAVVNKVDDVVKGAVMGNANSFSLTQIRDQVSNILNGNILGGLRTAADYARTWDQRTKIVQDQFNEDWKSLTTFSAIGNQARAAFGLETVAEQEARESGILSTDKNGNPTKVYSPTDKSSFIGDAYGDVVNVNNNNVPYMSQEEGNFLGENGNSIYREAPFTNSNDFEEIEFKSPWEQQKTPSESSQQKPNAAVLKAAAMRNLTNQ